MYTLTVIVDCFRENFVTNPQTKLYCILKVTCLILIWLEVQPILICQLVFIPTKFGVFVICIIMKRKKNIGIYKRT